MAAVRQSNGEVGPGPEAPEAPRRRSRSTTIAVEPATRRVSVAQGARQADTARAAYKELHGK